ncbi:lipid-A-disaccharide kinase [Pontibacter ummariensis]|uniref:Tetraacyldisaccharide 4'-kinase n=1 Tax=Pontibacter ummariensis TaxID=1610492 RepID=A0A239BN01_9BACT|nr:tetraacyldisaccharide 4'-kinase [Pontibacter ummariensis]PRY15715.1 lipid-A-disaccharide kinase [Pontibacter ummariensis]SNS09525.1 lipid-A-disaccharide kinase [Pontibacter ummariensis]
MVKYLQKLLWPFSLLYGGVTTARNFLYDKGIASSQQFELPVLAVGNLTVGGTGKTPHVEYLLRLLRSYRLATLSRGYKRKSKGFILADERSTASLLGDEPFQYHRDFPGVAVAVAESRVEGIQQIRQRVPGVEVVVLDDAMQHRPVKPSLLLMLTDFNRPFYEDLVLPAGLLRETRQGASRADLVIVTKCPPALGQDQQEKISKRVKTYSKPGTPVFFSAFAYGAPVSFGAEAQLSKRIVLVTGIANASSLFQYLHSQGYDILQHLAFPDHHDYSQEDLLQLMQLLTTSRFSGAALMTTRKDAVKLAGEALKDLTQELPFFYVPIEVQLLSGQHAFDELILQHVRSFYKKGPSATV